MGEVAIYKFKEFNEPVSVLPIRLGSLRNTAMLNENKDGYAIRYIAKKFNTTTKKRLLIVISDGKPAAPGYYGGEAQDHTKEEVDKVKQKGIDVLSISITEQAREANEYIYGEGNNVFNEDVNVIEGIVRGLLLKG
jgi:nitric oxide reductase activation protein